MHQHDDIVSSMILLNSALANYQGGALDVKYLEELSGEKLDLEQWYNDFLEEQADSPFPPNLVLGDLYQ